jgi:outer membrane immunogenic protein
VFKRHLAIASGFLLLFGLPNTSHADGPRPNWTGAYFGIQAGHGWGHSDIVTLDAPGVFVPESYGMQGALAGVHLGYNHQFGNIVVGGELSLDGSWLSGSKGPCLFGITPLPNDNCKTELDWLALALARVGYAQDGWMAYATGGWALAGITDRTNPAAALIGAPAEVGMNDMRSGLAWGGGLEVFLTQNLSAGLEYLHVGFAERANIVNTSTDRDFDLIRARLNFKLASEQAAWGSPRKATYSDIWTGTYFGIHAGYAWGRHRVELTPIGFPTFRSSFDSDGALAGAHLGMNRQVGPWVLGAELSLSDLRSSGGGQDCLADLIGPGGNCRVEFNWLLLGLGRVGYAWDNLMGYAAVGVAAAGITDTVAPPPTATNRVFSFDTTVPGIAYGAGIEMHLGQGWVGGVEYLRVNFDGKPVGPAIYTGTDRELDLIRVRLSVKLDESAQGARLPSSQGVVTPTIWNGTYFGLHAGYGWGTEDHTDSFFLNASVPPPVSYGYDVQGALAGGHLGISRQFGSWVLGGEIALSGVSIDGSLTDCVIRGTAHTDCRSQVDGLLTAMGRLGWTNNNWLVYGTAGWALASVNFETRRTDAGGAGIPQFAADNGFADGLAFGAGFEVALSKSVTAGVEFIHSDLASKNQPFNGSGTGERDLDLNVLRARLTFKQ